jgi:hypothetical protein
MRIGYWWESQKEKEQQEDIAVGGIIILKFDHRERGRSDMECIHLAQDRYQWRAPVDTVMNLRVP